MILITVETARRRGSQGEQHTIWILVSCDTSNLPLPVDQSVTSLLCSPGQHPERLDEVRPDKTHFSDWSNKVEQIKNFFRIKQQGIFANLLLLTI